jgi:hypothetical protein
MNPSSPIPQSNREDHEVVTTLFPKALARKLLPSLDLVALEVEIRDLVVLLHPFKKHADTHR